MEMKDSTARKPLRQAALDYNYDYLNEHTGRVSYAQSIYDSTLDRSYEYDHVGRLVISHSGAEARATRATSTTATRTTGGRIQASATTLRAISRSMEVRRLLT